jgi:hypothetical protein
LLKTARIWPFLLATVLIGVYMAVCAREFIADRKAKSGNLDAAISLDPGNATYYRKKAQLDLVAGDLSPAIEHLTEAARLNPTESETWLELASAQYSAGHPDQVLIAIQRATAADPHTASVHWRAGTYYFLLDHLEDTKNEMRIATAGDPHLTQEAIRVWWSYRNNESDVFQVIPRTPDAYSEALQFFIVADQLPRSLAAWNKFVELGPAPSTWVQAASYVNYLVTKGEHGTAARVWADGCRLEKKADYCDDSNYLVNGGFEQSITSSGYDWRFGLVGVSLNRDNVNRYSGESSLEVAFEGVPQNQIDLWQRLRVPAQQDFIVHAWYRPEIFGTAAKIKVIVEDAHGTRWGEGEIHNDARTWSELVFPFRSSDDPRGSQLRVLIEGGAVHGTLWLDDFQVRSATPPKDAELRSQP